MHAFETWQGLKAFADEELTLTPPAEVVRIAKTFLAQHRLGRPAAVVQPPSLASWANAVMATLTFDSYQAAPAGVRAASNLSMRHLVFQAQSLVVDVQVETDRGAGRLRLSGQVANGREPDAPMRNVWMSLFADFENVRTFQTNEFGEFHCALSDFRPLKLVVYAHTDVVAIPLDTLFDPKGHPPKHREH